MPSMGVESPLTPRISYLAPDGAGTMDFHDGLHGSDHRVIVPSGRPVVRAGSTSQTHAVERPIQGVGRERNVAESPVVLTATVQ